MHRVLVFILLIIVACKENENSVVQNSGRISGLVTSTYNDLPLSNVEISLLPTSVKTFTDENGNYSFSNIIEGEYKLVCSYEGFCQPDIVEAEIRVNANINLDLVMTPTYDNDFANIPDEHLLGRYNFYPLRKGNLLENFSSGMCENLFNTFKDNYGLGWTRGHSGDPEYEDERDFLTLANANNSLFFHELGNLNEGDTVLCHIFIHNNAYPGNIARNVEVFFSWENVKELYAEINCGDAFFQQITDKAILNLESQQTIVFIDILNTNSNNIAIENNSVRINIGDVEGCLGGSKEIIIRLLMKNI